jgi:hypothetical protein
MKSIYRFKDSNANFDVDFCKQIIEAGFKSTVGLCIYVKISHDFSNPKFLCRCTVPRGMKMMVIQCIITANFIRIYSILWNQDMDHHS